MTDPSSPPAAATGRAQEPAEDAAAGLTTVPEPRRHARRAAADEPVVDGPAADGVVLDESAADGSAADDAGVPSAPGPGTPVDAERTTTTPDADAAPSSGTAPAQTPADPRAIPVVPATAVPATGASATGASDADATPTGARGAADPATGVAAAGTDTDRRAAHRAENGPGSEGLPPTTVATPAATEGRPTVTTTRRRRLASRVTVAALVLLLAGVTTLAVHLYRTTTAWQEQADQYRTASSSLGEQLAASRAEVTGVQSELEAVRGQLTEANTRIDELANEKAQVTDDREAQRQLVDYQERVTEAAGKVALALDQCVQGQDQLITYLEAQAAAAEADAEPPYDETELEQYGTDVETLCRTASEANVALQDELDR